MSKDCNPNQWRTDEYSILLDCIEKYSFDLVLLLDEATQQVKRSEQSIIRKLKKMGYLHSGFKEARTFNKKFGHVR